MRYVKTSGVTKTNRDHTPNDSKQLGPIGCLTWAIVRKYFWNTSDRNVWIRSYSRRSWGYILFLLFSGVRMSQTWNGRVGETLVQLAKMHNWFRKDPKIVSVNAGSPCNYPLQDHLRAWPRLHVSNTTAWLPIRPPLSPQSKSRENHDSLIEGK